MSRRCPPSWVLGRSLPLERCDRCRRPRRKAWQLLCQRCFVKLPASLRERIQRAATRDSAQLLLQAHVEGTQSLTS